MCDPESFSSAFEVVLGADFSIRKDDDAPGSSGTKNIKLHSIFSPSLPGGPKQEKDVHEESGHQENLYVAEHT